MNDDMRALYGQMLGGKGVRPSTPKAAKTEADLLKEADDLFNQVLFQAPRSPIGFYSTVENALDAIKQEKGTPEQFKAMLLKNGAKQAEMGWMGWDSQFANSKSITKAEIQEWIDGNRIKVEEVQKGGFEWKENDLIVGGEVVANLVHNEDGTWSFQSDFSEGEESWETKFDAQKEEFDSQLSMLEAISLPMEMFTKTKAQLSAEVLGARERKSFNDEFDLIFPDTLILSEKYQYILDWYNVEKNRSYDKQLFTDVAGVPHVFAWGGIHGAIPNYKADGIILCCDVASLYPSIMIEYGYISRNVENPDKYREIRDTRLRLKAEKNPMQQPLKIVLNSTYGAMKDKHNNLYDPLMGIS